MSDVRPLEIPVWQTGQPGGEMRVVPADVEGPVLSEESRAQAEKIAARYPTRRSALIPLLYLVQAEAGWVPRRGMREVADILGLTTAEVEAVATFYTMLKLHPCGKYVISICTNPSCSLLGGRRLYDQAKKMLGDHAEQVTEDGLFTLEEEECLAACDKAPVLTVNYLYYDKVTDEQLQNMIASIRNGEVPEAARGGVPGELKEVSKVLAGLGEGPEARSPGGPRREDARGGGVPGRQQPPAHEEVGDTSPRPEQPPTAERGSDA